ncbi:MAG: serine/threonine-protein kinase [Kofleriaceae bacterium]
MEEPLQKSLERYDVLDRIAVGGMAEVFLAKAYGAHGFEKTIAIKRILPELASDPEFAARFIAEAKVAVRLSHANIVQVLDFGRIGESLFIAMEYVDGLDLAAMLRKFKDEGRQIPLPAAFHIAIEIIRGLDFAHSHNVVHRDVSPSNILVSRAGEVKIADFGIAVAAQPHRGGGPGPKKVMGKWRYMSPEQTRGDTLDTRSDVFSAASVIFELFTGVKLFPGDESEDITRNIETMPIPKMASLRPGLPSRLDDVLAGPLARKPIDRPSRPASVLRALIELSYESSIMATALDVAEALATVIPAKRQSGRGALDDVIRKQLAENPTAARRTAVTEGQPPGTQTQGEVSTGLFRKVDLDGLSRLEEVDSTAIRSPRARRNSEHPPAANPGDTDLHKLYDASQDRDRHTEVGGPPTGEVPKDLDLGRSVTKSRTQEIPGRSSRTGWAVLIAAFLGAGGVAVVAMSRNDERASPAPQPPPDDQVAVETGTVEIVTTPPGASGTINGQAFGPTPIRIKNVQVGVAKLHLELTGYVPFDDDVTVPKGVTVSYRRSLIVAPAKLQVTTEPGGAQVILGDRPLGVTPLAREGLAAESKINLTLAKTGFESQTFPIDLVAGKTTEITRTLKPAQRFGLVQLRMASGWGDVFLNGKKIARAPTRAVKLPVGRVTLHLVNDGDRSKPPIKWTASCDVKEAEPNICTIGMP